MDEYSQLGDTSTLLRLTGEAKVAGVAALCETLLDGGDEKVVVFTRHRHVAALLRLELLRFNPVIYQGGMSDAEKAAAVAQFATQFCRVFIGNITAAGTGINGLQDASSVCVFAENSWVPGEMTQAAKRLHRMGQTASRVRAYVTYLPDSLEEAVLGARRRKEKVIGGLGL
jgi:SNF2 family DNA or RNA helicase